MTRDVCPHDPATRAKLCATCCKQHSLPPCAQGWLRARLIELRWERIQTGIRAGGKRRRAA